MQLRMIVAAIVGAAVVTWAGVLWLGGATLGAAMLQPYGTVVFAVTMLALAFETILWRLPIVRSFVAKRPPIAGTWRATLVSNYIQPDGSQTVKTVYVVIAQSLTRLSVRMFTDKAHSRSLAERISPSQNDELFELAIVYQNIPNIDQRTAERGGKIHFGALLIPNVPYSAETLRGHYWTDRRTEGSLTLLERRAKLASSYEQAQRLFE
jgi:hypothetical protein